MDNEETQQISYIAEYVVGAGYVIFFCLAVTLCSLFYYFTYLQSSYNQSRHVAINPLATRLPPTTPAPHVSTDEMKNSTRIFEDDFSKDQNHWTHYSDQIKEEIRKGKLYFESRVEDNWNFTECYSCPILKKPFYLQADLATDKATDQMFGIVFGLNRTDDNFYSFLINTESKRYYFYHLNYFGWSLRASGASDQIRSFPAENTLGIYVNQDTIEFYVNGEIIDSYKESGAVFNFGYFGFYVENSGFQLIADNLTIREAGKK